MAEVVLTSSTYTSVADVTRDLILFAKVQDNVPFDLFDFPLITVGRWAYLSSQWKFLRRDVLSTIDGMSQETPEDINLAVRAREQLYSFDAIVDSSVSQFQNPLSDRSAYNQYEELFRLITIDTIPITVNEQKIIDSEIARIGQFNRNTFENMRARVRLTHDTLVDGMGIGSADYDALYSRVPGAQIVQFRVDNYAALVALRRIMTTIETLLPVKNAIVAQPDPFQQIRTAINNPDIKIGSFTSGFVIPFPTGSTLERLALRFLGDANRWMDIVIANGLQFPYIDETGQSVPLLFNGNRNVIVVQGVQFENLALDMEVFIGSDFVDLEPRRIVNLTYRTDDDTVIVELDGPADLSKMRVLQGSYLFFYKNNTVNGSRFILIPSGAGVGLDVNRNEPYFTKNLPEPLKQMDVDLRLGDDDDLLLNTNNDFELAYGLVAAAQAVRLKFDVKLQELVQNPGFGSYDLAGRILNSDSPADLVTLLINQAVANDNRFAGTNDVSVSVSGNTMFVSATILIAGSNTAVPLTFALPTSGA